MSDERGTLNGSELSHAVMWRARAEEAHALANRMSDPQAKATMLDLAVMYRAMARHAEEWYAKISAMRSRRRQTANSPHPVS